MTQSTQKKPKSITTAEITDALETLSHQPSGTLYEDVGTPPPGDTASKQQQLDALFAPYKACQQCPLATQGRNSVVFGEGNPDARLMFVGEGPGRDEDRLGRPFVGRAGKLLDKIITAMGTTREKVYITNVVKCRPPGNRAPLPEEAGPCRSLFLLKQIEIVKPEIVCTLGATATQGVLGREIKIGRVRGSFLDLDGVTVMPTFHPAYLLRNPSAKRLVWDDMQKIMHRLDFS